MSLMKPLVLHLLKCKQFILHGIEWVKYSNWTTSSLQSQVCQNLLIKMRSICQKLGEKLLKYAIFLLLFKISSFLYHSNLPARALNSSNTVGMRRHLTTIQSWLPGQNATILLWRVRRGRGDPLSVTKIFCCMLVGNFVASRSGAGGRRPRRRKGRTVGEWDWGVKKGTGHVRPSRSALPSL